jgi:hypothetical protein
MRLPGSDPSSPLRSRGLKRSHSPSIDAQDSESQDSYAGPPAAILPGHQESDFNPGLNEGGETFGTSVQSGWPVEFVKKSTEMHPNQFFCQN